MTTRLSIHLNDVSVRAVVGEKYGLKFLQCSWWGKREREGDNVHCLYLSPSEKHLFSVSFMHHTQTHTSALSNDTYKRTLIYDTHTNDCTPSVFQTTHTHTHKNTLHTPSCIWSDTHSFKRHTLTDEPWQTQSAAVLFYFIFLSRRHLVFFSHQLLRAEQDFMHHINISYLIL